MPCHTIHTPGRIGACEPVGSFGARGPHPEVAEGQRRPGRRRLRGVGCLALGAFLGCMAPNPEAADGGLEDARVPAADAIVPRGDGACSACESDGGPRPGVVCGPMQCPVTQLCMVPPGGEPSCIPRGHEPVHPPPLNYVFVYCDEHGDCGPGHRCAASRGEWTRIQCMMETPEAAPDCFVHANHLCRTDDDCHVCRTGGNPPARFTCLAFREAGLGALKSCQLQ